MTSHVRSAAIFAPIVRGTILCFVVLALVACGAKKAKAPKEDDVDPFAELAKNDRDDTSSVKAEANEERPKGPVYPAPFTAEQIHEATKNGRTYRFKVEMPGKPAKEYSVTFRKVDDNGAEVFTDGGQSKRMGWLMLQQHAEFPRDRVTTREDKLKTPAGKFECIVYELQGEDGEVWTYYFAKKLPGAPVFFYCERNGKRVRTTTLVEHIAGR